MPSFTTVASARAKRVCLLDARRTSRQGGFVNSVNGIAGIKGKEKTLTRKRFQTGSVRLRDDSSSSWWEGFYREDVRQKDGSIVRKQRTLNLGHKSEIPTKRLALRKLAEKLVSINDPHYRPDMDMRNKPWCGSIASRAPVPANSWAASAVHRFQTQLHLDRGSRE